jgi:adenylylsulfate kinase-like enzyme
MQTLVKGLYKKAREGKIPNMTGISSPYEPPDSPAFVAETHVESVDSIIRKLRAKLV